MKCGVRVDRAVGADPARAADHAVAGPGDQLDPDLVGVDRPLAERVAEAERPDDDLDEIRLARLERRDLGPERAEQRAVDPAAVAEGEEVDADLACP